VPDGDLGQLARRLAAREARAGDVIVRQGERGTCFYIVEEGSFDVYERGDGDDGMGKKVNEVAPGGGFGELSLLYNAPRSATVVATGAGRLWRMEGADFLNVMSQATQLPERILKSFRENTQLGGLFWLLPEVDFLQLCKTMSPRDFEAGESVVTEGDIGTSFYVVDAGSFQVSSSGKPITQLGPGDSFGELALLYDKPRSATVVATSTSRVWIMERERFQKAVAKIDERPVMRRTVDFLRGVKLFNGLAEEELKQLANILRPQVLKAGHVLARAGEDIKRIYILQLGEVKAWEPCDFGERQVAVYNEPAAVIEEASVQSTKWPYTLRSDNDLTLVLWISKLTFENMFDGSKEKLVQNLESSGPDWWPFR